ncbi:MAG: Flp pilus assembly protein CpaB [Ramlibacter sp.]
MRNLKAILLLALALLLGLAAAAYATRWISQRGHMAATRVVVAAADIEMGTRVGPQMLTVVDWPSGSVPPGAFSDVAALQDRVTRMSVLRGDAVLERKLAPAGTKGGLSAVIAEGKRAMTVRVNDVVGVAGFALPGNYVDVMVNAQQNHGNGEQNPISLTVLEQVLVLAVAQEADRDDTKPKVVTAVTLELSPADAEKLDLARSVGTLSLVLRNQLDKQAITTAGITRAQLLGLRDVSSPMPMRAAAKAPAHPHVQPVAARECVEVIRNSASAMHCF